MSRIVGTLNATLPVHLERDTAQELRLALAQVAPAPYSSSVSPDEAEASALRVIERLASEAGSAGADILVLPEYFMTGVEHAAWRAVGEREAPLGAHDSPLQDPQHFLHSVARIAQTADIDIVAGTAVEAGTHHHLQHRSDEAPAGEKDEGTGKVYNTAYYVGRDGQLKGSYTKRVSKNWHTCMQLTDPRTYCRTSGIPSVPYSVQLVQSPIPRRERLTLRRSEAERCA